MGYYLLPRSAAPPDLAALRARLESGPAPGRREALLALVAAGAERELTACLASPQSCVVQLAVAGLWECWLSEAGPLARRRMEAGIAAMNEGDLAAAAAIFTELMAAHPDWAEAANKQATVLYLQGQPEESIALCQKVVALKPDHFGAWNGMALCALQVEDWTLAHEAVQQSRRLQPASPTNLQLLQLIESRLPQV